MPSALSTPPLTARFGAHLIKITDETNTKEEKALYIKEAFDGFSRILGNVHEESYIYVQDVRAASYGYGGFTQEFRFHH
jgi:4-oxalocrotonate tautomerase